MNTQLEEIDGWVLTAPGRPNYTYHHEHLAESEAKRMGLKSFTIKPFKYLSEPKDELFEKWMEYSNWCWSDASNRKTIGVSDKAAFNKMKELGLFTHALDEAIERIKRDEPGDAHAHHGCITDYALEEIRSKYTTETE